MLQASCYRDYYKTLPAPQLARLNELFEIAAIYGLGVPAAYVVEIERYGYRVNVFNGMVTLSIDGAVIECGQWKAFTELIELAIIARATGGNRQAGPDGQPPATDGSAARVEAASADPAFVIPPPSLAQVNGGRYG